MAEERVLRRLAAILAADVVGYSRLMGVDDAGTRARFNANLTELIEPAIAERRGRIVKTTGDALLVEFASVVDAVECAVDIQSGMAERNGKEPDDRRIVFRIGVNLGDVIVEGNDIHGDGVNVAARLEGLCAPGEVYVSGTVFDQAEGKLAAAFDDLGERTVKNIAKSVRVYRAHSGEDTEIRQEQPANAALSKKSDLSSIAVLPFDNLSGDSEQEYFADGLTEDIITALSYWHSFSVIARNSTFQYKGQSPDVRQVATHLGVQYVLEGSVRKSGDRVRISAQLVDGTTGNHVWAKRFDRKLEDFFDLQDEITELIAAKVEPEFAKAEQKRATRKPPNNFDSWECYQRGIASLNELTKEGNLRAQELFARAIEIDPRDSRPHSGMAYCLLRYSYDGFSDTPVYASEESIQYAKRAVALDEGDAQAHETLAILLLHSDDPEGSLAAGRRAIEINPNFAHAHVPVGNLLSLTGKASEGVKYLERAVRLNPDDIRSHIYLALLADAHLNNRDYDQAEGWARKSIEWKRDFPHSHMSLASALGHLGEITAAKLELAECFRLSPNYLRIHPILQFYRDPADREHYLDGLRKAGLSE